LPPRPQLAQWRQELAGHFPGLSPVFVALLALWSFGIILARNCGLDTVSLHIARLQRQRTNTVRQRLREFYQEAPAKAGAKRGGKRRDFDVTSCFVPLLRWLLSLWPCTRLALALDVTNLGSKFHVLCVSVLYGGIGIPVAWKILPGNQKKCWNDVWCELLHTLQPAIGPEWTVAVLTDRGLESTRLFQEIVDVGWHPLMRVKAAGTFRPVGWMHWHKMAWFVPRVGDRFAAVGVAYKSADGPLACTLLACWEPGHEDPWLILTDLPVAASSPSWYAFRAWIEQGFKMIKSGGLQWQRTRMTKAERAERVWLAIAVSMLWLVVLGAAVEADERRETLGKVCTAALPHPVRRHRLFLLGLAEWQAGWQSGGLLALGWLEPEVWSDTWHDYRTSTEEEFCSKELYP
jgi:hypothetical protein